MRNLLFGDAHPVGHGAYAWTANRAAILPVHQAAQTYIARNTPLAMFAGINYGAGSSRDWAAKAPALLGVRAVIARSFERIHRSNLIGIGIFLLELAKGTMRASMALPEKSPSTWKASTGSRRRQ